MSHEWIYSSRRQVLISVATSGTAYFLGLSDIFSAEATQQTTASTREGSKTNGEATQDKPPSPKKQRTEIATEKSRLQELLGTSYRVPEFDVKSSTSHQYQATGSSERKPDRLTSSFGSFSSENSNRVFLNSGHTALETASRSSQTGDQAAKAGVEWAAAVTATGEKLKDVAISQAVEDIGVASDWRSRGLAFVITTTVDLLTPTPLSESPWKYEDRLSPSEKAGYRKELFQRLGSPLQITIPPNGPILQNNH